MIINVAACFELTISAIYWHILDLEPLPAGLTCLGYAFLLPGLIFTIGGQGIIENTSNEINFELYRPTEVINDTRISGAPNLKHSYLM